jgi:serine/threonine-protein kinase OSR1/STK39
MIASSAFPSDPSGYSFLHVIGSGSSGDVYHARCISNNRDVAVKIIDLEKERSNLDYVRQEVAFWSACDHTNIVSYHTSFVASHYLYIVMEYLGIGSVSGILRDRFPNGFPDEAVIGTILRDTASALGHIHAQGQIHRDVKPGNLIIGEDGTVKLGDFGVAAALVENGERHDARYTTTGTPCYMAPEMFQNSAGHTEKADIWSLGITAIELAVGVAPFAGLTIGAIVPKILKAPPPQLPRNRAFSRPFRDFVRKCMNADPERRASAVDLLNHPFLTQYQHNGPEIVTSVISNLAPLHQRFQARFARLVSELENDNAFDQISESRSKIEWSFQKDEVVQQGRFTIRRSCPNIESIQ